MKNSWKIVVKAIRKNIERNPFIKKDKGTPDKLIKIPVTTNRSKFVIGLLAQKLITISKNIANNLLRGSKR